LIYIKGGNTQWTQYSAIFNSDGGHFLRDHHTIEPLEFDFFSSGCKDRPIMYKGEITGFEPERWAKRDGD